jgi:hypothetical protein
MSHHIADEKAMYDIYKEYGLSNKETWFDYRDKLAEIAKDNKEFTDFKKEAIDRYIEQRGKDYQIKYYRSNNLTQNFRPTSRSKDITEDEMKQEDKAYRAFLKLDSTSQRANLFQLEFYEKGVLTTRFYYNGHMSNSLIKKEVYDKDGNITDTQYYTD